MKTFNASLSRIVALPLCIAVCLLLASCTLNININGTDSDVSDQTETTTSAVSSDAASSENVSSAAQIAVPQLIEVMHEDEQVPNAPYYTRHYRIPALKSDAQNVGAFNEKISDFCNEIITDIKKPENNDLVLDMEYAGDIDSGVAAVLVVASAYVADSEMGWSYNSVFYYDYINDSIISDWKEYAKTKGYDPQKLTDAFFKTEDMKGFTTENEYWKVSNLSVTGFMYGEKQCVFTILYDYEGVESSGTGMRSAFEVDTGELMSLYS